MESFVQFVKSKTGLVTLGFLTVAAFFLVTEHTAHVFGLLPYALLLLCPLMHLFMHGDHGDHGAHASYAGHLSQSGQSRYGERMQHVLHTSQGAKGVASNPSSNPVPYSGQIAAGVGTGVGAGIEQGAAAPNAHRPGEVSQHRDELGGGGML